MSLHSHPVCPHSRCSVPTERSQSGHRVSAYHELAQMLAAFFVLSQTSSSDLSWKHRLNHMIEGGPPGVHMSLTAHVRTWFHSLPRAFCASLTVKFAVLLAASFASEQPCTAGVGHSGDPVRGGEERSQEHMERRLRWAAGRYERPALRDWRVRALRNHTLVACTSFVLARRYCRRREALIALLGRPRHSARVRLLLRHACARMLSAALCYFVKVRYTEKLSWPFLFRRFVSQVRAFGETAPAKPADGSTHDQKRGARPRGAPRPALLR